MTSDERSTSREERKGTSRSTKDADEKMGCGVDANEAGSSGSSGSSRSSGTKRAGYTADCSSMSQYSDSSSERSMLDGGINNDNSKQESKIGQGSMSEDKKAGKNVTSGGDLNLAVGRENKCSNEAASNQAPGHCDQPFGPSTSSTMTKSEKGQSSHQSQHQIDLSSVKLVQASSLVNGLLSSQVPNEVKYLNHDGVVDGSNSKFCKDSPDLVDEYINLLKSCNPFFDSYMSMVQDTTESKADISLKPHPDLSADGRCTTQQKQDAISNYEGDNNSDGSSMVVLARSRRMKRRDNDTSGRASDKHDADESKLQSVLDSTKLNGSSILPPIQNPMPSNHPSSAHAIQDIQTKDEQSQSNVNETHGTHEQIKELYQNQSHNSDPKDRRFVSDTAGTNTTTSNNGNTGSGSNTGSGNETFGATDKRESNGSTNSQESNQDSEENDKKKKATSSTSTGNADGYQGERISSPQHTNETMNHSNSSTPHHGKSPSSREYAEADSITSTQERLAMKKRKRMDMRREYEEDVQRQYQGSTSESGESIKEELFKPGFPVSLEEVLSFTTTARLVASSLPPYIIIHTNAAFSKLMGIHNAVGKSVFTVLVEKCSNQVETSTKDQSSIEQTQVQTCSGDNRNEAISDTAEIAGDTTPQNRQKSLERIIRCCGYGQLYVVDKTDQSISVQIPSHDDQSSNLPDKHKTGTSSIMSICPIIKSNRLYSYSNHDRDKFSQNSGGNSNSSCNSGSKKRKIKHDRMNSNESTTHYLFQFQALEDPMSSSARTNASVTSNQDMNSDSGENGDGNQRVNGPQSNDVPVLTCA